MKKNATQAWRHKLGIAQSEAAKTLGVHLRTWQRWEAGDSRVPLAATKAMVAILRSKQK